MPLCRHVQPARSFGPWPMPGTGAVLKRASDTRTVKVDRGKYMLLRTFMGSERDALIKPRGNDPAQRTLLNFDVVDPFMASTIEAFKDQFKRLNGGTLGLDLSTY